MKDTAIVLLIAASLVAVSVALHVLFVLQGWFR